MTEQQIALLVDFHKDNERQGPGSPEQTLKAMSLTGLDVQAPLNVVDIGCGSGAQTLTLAQATDWQITAVDLFPQFLERLQERASSLQLDDQITTANHSMSELPFEENGFDLIWSEGAIYIMGFQEGIHAWRPLLKENGILAVSEISWITDARPRALHDYWIGEYPQMDTIANKSAQLEAAGYEVLGHFILPESCWTDQYYYPNRKRMPGFLDRHDHAPEAEAFIRWEQEEIAMYEKYKDYYSYAFYVARKV